jgi:hypothetical protein
MLISLKIGSDYYKIINQYSISRNYRFETSGISLEKFCEFRSSSVMTSERQISVSVSVLSKIREIQPKFWYRLVNEQISVWAEILVQNSAENFGLDVA